MRGFYVHPMTIDRDTNTRWHAAQAYYYPIDGRANLHVIRGTAAKILWKTEDDCDAESKVATGVQYVDNNGTTSTVGARKEVILSAGAHRTPLILKGSGVGNTKWVDNHVPPTRDGRSCC